MSIFTTRSVSVRSKVNIPLPQHSLFANIVMINLNISCIIIIIKVIIAKDWRSLELSNVGPGAIIHYYLCPFKALLNVFYLSGAAFSVS